MYRTSSPALRMELTFLNESEVILAVIISWYWYPFLDTRNTPLERTFLLNKVQRTITSSQKYELMSNIITFLIIKLSLSAKIFTT